ncbi:hypothetical protein B0H10DRAFT_2167219 [Mycena sp. CBHHK59/15]|nr:hypothetical protein B0H10DRAFT_2167219 [Mycena sp. CBHHK59/15]
MWEASPQCLGLSVACQNFPRADIYELLSPDLLHQVIKGAFKDHLVAWVGKYLENEHGKAKAKKIMADIDRRIMAVPPFLGLRRFPEGRGFKQWTGDDSKALMKVSHVPPQMLHTFSAFLDFCYLVCQNVVDEATLTAIDAALARYHQEQAILTESGVAPNGFCLPRQHSLPHYCYLIQEFGTPNGLCLSITESKHIKAVKELWRQSSQYKALSQMLTINDRLNKLAVACMDFVDRGMMAGPSTRPLPPSAPAPPLVANEDEDDDGGASDKRKILGEVILAKIPMRQYPRNPIALAQHLNLPQLIPLIHCFLYLQADHNLDIPLTHVPLDNCPDALSSVKVFPSATAKFYRHIRAVHPWHGGAPRYDCVFVEGDPDLPGFWGLLAAPSITYPCTLVTWFLAMGDEPCPDVGMWMVEPDVDHRRRQMMDIIHIDTILHGVHLIGIYGDTFLPQHFKYSDTLDRFKAFYINKYVDHHANEIAF